jgi:outer membrane receptor protein involved in Fe transport
MHNKARIAVTAAAACSMTLMHQNLRAQSAEQTEESKTEEAPLATVTVTGSLLPTTPDQAAVPIIALDAKALEQSGVASNPLEILRKSIPAFEGRSNAGTSNANNDNQRTAGGSQLQLRNLPTLVLINGQRVANSAIGGLNGKSFVDVNQIPAAAIARIEVLTDGASSIYGSDAIGGVVNFILKSDVDGIWAGGRYGGAEGGYKERSGYVTAGTDVGGWKLTATGSFNKTDPLFQNQRSFTSPLYVVYESPVREDLVDSRRGFRRKCDTRPRTELAQRDQPYRCGRDGNFSGATDCKWHVCWYHPGRNRKRLRRVAISDAAVTAGARHFCGECQQGALRRSSAALR